MKLNIARWDNSLALRIPADYARRVGLKEGSNVEASLTVDGGIAIRPSRWNRKAFAQELTKTARRDAEWCLGNERIAARGALLML